MLIVAPAATTVSAGNTNLLQASSRCICSFPSHLDIAQTAACSVATSCRMWTVYPVWTSVMWQSRANLLETVSQLGSLFSKQSWHLSDVPFILVLLLRGADFEWKCLSTYIWCFHTWTKWHRLFSNTVSPVMRSGPWPLGLTVPRGSNSGMSAASRLELAMGTEVRPRLVTLGGGPVGAGGGAEGVAVAPTSVMVRGQGVRSVGLEKERDKAFVPVLNFWVYPDVFLNLNTSLCLKINLDQAQLTSAASSLC